MMGSNSFPPGHELGDEQDNDENDDGDFERDSNQLNVAGSASTSAPVVVVPSKLKKKKNKGKKKGKKDFDVAERQAVVDDEESVDKLLEKFAIGNVDSSSLTLGRAPSQVGRLHDRKARELPNVLAVDTKHLRAEDELRRIFGSRVIYSVEKRQAIGAQRKRQTGGIRRMPLKRTLLVVPMEHWARWDAGITMECTKVEGCIKHFRYQYSACYQDVQKRFEACVASYDPNTIITLLREHPYHVDSLLALAEFYKQMGEHQRSTDLWEQCLYALECAWHPEFNPSLGTCRLEFSWDMNKALFRALFCHMQRLGRRGCHRTALEVCKLLLSLDPSDPLGALFCIDYFALRAEQYEWLVSFVYEYEPDKSTSVLPNFSFSVAIACFYIESQQSDHSKPSGSSVKGNTASSASLLQQALMRYPSVLKKIIAKAPIKEDDSWTKIVNHVRFSRTSGLGPTLEHLVDIFVERNYLIWRSPELQGWLKASAAVVTQVAGSNISQEMANWKGVREELFDSNENEYKHLHISDFSDSTSTIPPEDRPDLGFHPHRDVLEQFDLVEGGHLQQGDVQEGLHGRNALLVFLQSLVPLRDYGGEAPVEDAPALLEEGSDQYDSGGGDDDLPL